MTSEQTRLYLISGDNYSLLTRKLEETRKQLVAEYNSLDIVHTTTIADFSQALQTSPMFTEKQLIILQATLTAAQQTDIPKILPYISADHDTLVILCLDKPSAAVKKTVDALDGISYEVTGKAYKESAQLIFKDSPVELTSEAKNLLLENVGQEVEAIYPILDVMLSTKGAGAKITAQDIQPFLSAKGAIPVWDLTDSIDNAQPARALDIIDRLLWTTTPYALLAVVTAHFERMFRLSAAGITNEVEAASFLGMKGSTYPAKKALMTARKYGKTLPTLVGLLAKASNDMKGGTGIPPRVVLEITIGRLCSYPRH